MYETLLYRRAAYAGTWLGEQAEEYSGLLGDIEILLPSFERQPFGLNPRLDMIVSSAQETDTPVHVGTVSKRYTLVQHMDVVDALRQALAPMSIDADGLDCRLTMTESGSRMVLRVHLPDAFACTPPDGHTMALTYECFNSVDGSVPLFALLGWFRFVCSNGLVIGTTHARLRRQHRPSLCVDELGTLLGTGLQSARDDVERLVRCAERRVSLSALAAWVDGPVARAWGPSAATRVHAVVTRGEDGVPSRHPRRAPPHRRHVEMPVPVPGARAGGDSEYDLVQALSWIASRRENVAQADAWRAQIDDLVAQA